MTNDPASIVLDLVNSSPQPVDSNRDNQLLMECSDYDFLRYLFSIQRIFSQFPDAFALLGIEGVISLTQNPYQ